MQGLSLYVELLLCLPRNRAESFGLLQIKSIDFEAFYNIVWLYLQFW